MTSTLLRFGLFLVASISVVSFGLGIRHGAIRVPEKPHHDYVFDGIFGVPRNKSDHAPPEDKAGSYTIKNTHGICLEAPRGNIMGTMIHMWLCSPAEHNQQWTYDAGTNQVKNVHGICLDARDPRKDGGIILMWPCNRTCKQQKWEYIESTHQLKNAFGKCMDAANRTGDNGLVQMWECQESNPNQRWEVVRVEEQPPSEINETLTKVPVPRNSESVGPPNETQAETPMNSSSKISADTKPQTPAIASTEAHSETPTLKPPETGAQVETPTMNSFETAVGNQAKTPMGESLKTSSATPVGTPILKPSEIETQAEIPVMNSFEPAAGTQAKTPTAESLQTSIVAHAETPTLKSPEIGTQAEIPAMNSFEPSAATQAKTPTAESLQASNANQDETPTLKTSESGTQAETPAVTQAETPAVTQAETPAPTIANKVDISTPPQATTGYEFHMPVKKLPQTHSGYTPERLIGDPDETAYDPKTQSNSITSEFKPENSVSLNIIEPVTFKYFKFITKKLRQPDRADAYCVQLSEFLLHNKSDKVDYSHTPVVATNPGGDNPDVEPPAAVVDGNEYSKWSDRNIQPLLLEFVNPIAVTHFTFITGNDFPERDPVQWIFMGSNDKLNWSDLHSQFLDAEVTLARNSMSTFWYPLGITSSKQ